MSFLRGLFSWELYHAPQKHYLPEKKTSTRIIFEITVARFELFRINFKELPDTLCICVSCMTLPA